MNQKGWGLSDALLFVGVVALAILITTVIYNRNLKELFGDTEEKTTYSDIENDMIKAAKAYTDNYYNKILDNGDSDYVSTEVLQENKLFGIIKDPNNKSNICTGYVYFYKENGATTYVPYLNCGSNYKTSGYEENNSI